MRKTKVTTIAVCVATLAASTPSLGGDQPRYPERDGRFLERSEEGWFFYEPPLPPEEEHEEEPEEVVEIDAPEPDEPPEPETQPADEKPPEVFTVEWFRDNLDRYKNQAINDPTPQNVAVFLQLQQVAMDQAQRFSETAKEVVATNPRLDESTRAPVGAGSGVQRAKQFEVKEGRERALKEIGESAGLFFFFEPGEFYHERMARVVNNFQRLHDIEVIAISLDPTDLSSPIFDDVFPDEGHSEQLNIMATPALFLVEEGREPINIAQGNQTGIELEERMVMIGNMRGLISNESYRMAQQRYADAPTLDERPDPRTFRGDEGQALNVDDDGFIDPEEMMPALRSQYNSGRQQ